MKRKQEESVVIEDEELLRIELEKLRNLPPLSPNEQKIVDAIAEAMVQKTLEDLAQGIHHKPVKRKK